MALSAASLRAGLLALFQSYPGDPGSAANRFALVYDSYARAVQASSVTSVGSIAEPVFTGSEVQKLEQALFSVLSSYRTATAHALANAWGRGVFDYWTSPPVTFTGVCVVPPPPPDGFQGLVQTGFISDASAVRSIIVPQMTTLFFSFRNTYVSTASRMASILDSATRTITITIAPPPASPGILV
jgi:hypothetical protein